jgi:hypothetical protein
MGNTDNGMDLLIQDMGKNPPVSVEVDAEDDAACRLKSAAWSKARSPSM